MMLLSLYNDLDIRVPARAEAYINLCAGMSGVQGARISLCYSQIDGIMDKK
jgi:hypothetical protein